MDRSEASSRENVRKRGKLLRTRPNRRKRPYHVVLGLDAYRLEDRIPPGSVLHIWMGAVLDSLGMKLGGPDEAVGEDVLTLGSSERPLGEGLPRDDSLQDAAWGGAQGDVGARSRLRSSAPGESPKPAAPWPRSSSPASLVFSLDALALEENPQASSVSYAIPEASPGAGVSSIGGATAGGGSSGDVSAPASSPGPGASAGGDGGVAPPPGDFGSGGEGGSTETPSPSGKDVANVAPGSTQTSSSEETSAPASANSNTSNAEPSPERFTADRLLTATGGGEGAPTIIAAANLSLRGAGRLFVAGTVP